MSEPASALDKLEAAPTITQEDHWPRWQEHFYVCPNTGQLVYQFADEHLSLIDSELRAALREVARAAQEVADALDPRVEPMKRLRAALERAGVR